MPVAPGKDAADLIESDKAKVEAESEKLNSEYIQVNKDLAYVRAEYKKFQNKIFEEMPKKFTYIADDKTRKLLMSEVSQLNFLDTNTNSQAMSETGKQSLHNFAQMIRGFNSNRNSSEWWKMIPGDKLRLAYTPYDNNLGMMANGGNTFKIKDGAKEIFYGLQNGHTFTIEEEGLVEIDQNGRVVDTYNHEQALGMVKKVDDEILEEEAERELAKAE